MTSAVSIELRFLIDTVNNAADLAQAREDLSRIDAPLEILTLLPAENLAGQDIVPLIDLTGNSVIRTMRDGVANVIAISLEVRRRVIVWGDTTHGPLQMEFSRRRVSASIPHQLLVIMVVMGALMTTIAYFFLRNQLRPIKRMAAAAADYGKGRITRFTPTVAVEVRAAGMAFLDMRNRLERQTQSRTLMLSGVSHDLRTPLTRLRLGLSLMNEEEVAPMIRDVDDMQRLLDGFLDFARSDASDHLQEVIPADLVESVLEDCRRMGQAVTLGGIEGPRQTIKMRDLAIRRALDNLINNALRYGFSSGALCHAGHRHGFQHSTSLAS